MDHWRYIDILDDSVKINVDNNGKIFYLSTIHGWNKNDKSDREELVQVRCDIENLRKMEVKISDYEVLLNDHRILVLIERIQNRFKEEFRK